MVGLQNTGIYGIYNPKALAVPACVLKSNFLHVHVLVPLAAAVTTKHRENVYSSN